MRSQKSLLEKIIADFFIAVSGKEENFTSGSIRRAIFLLSVPMVLEMGMESVFAVVDIFFVSKVGTRAVATVGLTESVLMIVYSIAIGLSMAVTAIVARRIGEKKPEQAADAAFQGIFLGVVLALLIGIPGYLYAGETLALMGGEEALIKEGKGYTKIMYAGNISILLLFLNNAILRGAGNASVAMRALIISNSLNLLLDPLFIFGLGPIPEMGVTGAAVATTIGRSTGVLYQFYVLFTGTSIIKIARRNIVLRIHDIKEMFKIAGGGITQFIVESLSWMFLIRIISDFGEAAVAGYTLAFRVIVFTILPSWGMSNAAATLVGQNLGAEKPERAESSVWKTAWYNMVFLGIVSVVFFLFAEPIMSVFEKSTSVLEYGKRSLQIICLGYVFFAYGMVISQSFNGAGDTKTPMLINLLCFWIIQIPMAYLLSYHVTIVDGEWVTSRFLGTDGVLISIAICHTIHALISIWVFRKGKWKLTKV
ncbi:MAG: MATE family efflux transporter [Cyclobacteriaceae bacterium]